MADRIRTILIVSILAVVVWLFAEAESLGEDEVSARIEFPPPAATSLLVRSDPPNPTVKVGLRGGKAALQRARSVLEAPIRLEPGRGVPDTDAARVIDLADALRRNQALAETRVTIEYVRPPTLEVTVETLQTRAIEVRPDLPDLQTEALPVVTPPTVEVRLPRSLAERLDETIVARARPVSEQNGAPLAPGAHSITAPVQLPSTLHGQPGVSLLTDRVRVEFTVVSTLVTETLPAVPVQILLAPTEANEWFVTMDAEDQILSVELTGPRAIMSELKSDSVNASIVAILYLSDIDLQSGVTAKSVSFALLRDGILHGLPRDVAVRAERSEVRFRSERVVVP